jgi:hypothetical protein
MRNWQHIVPLNDLIEHNTDGLDCPCNPDIDFDDRIVIHSALDRRECFEQNQIKEKDYGTH